jgi:hypothetical protein
MPRCERSESKPQTDFFTRMGECSTQPQVIEAIHRTLVDFRRRGVISSLPPELQGLSVPSADQLGRWVAASQRAFARHGETGSGSDSDLGVLMVELLCSADRRLMQISSEKPSCLRRACRETGVQNGVPQCSERMRGTANE